MIHFIKRIMARSRRAVTQDPATSGEAAATATLDQSQGIEYGMRLLHQARSVFIHEGNKNVRERERVAELYKEEKEVGAEAQDLESRAEKLRIVEAKKKEERAGAEREVGKSEEKIARVKEALQEIMDIMDSQL